MPQTPAAQAPNVATADERLVSAMFSAIAPRYDVLNRLLSLRRDVAWRRQAIASLQCAPGERLLDVATGTADMLIEAATQYPAKVRLIGIDLSYDMLRYGIAKLAPHPAAPPVHLFAGSGLELPYRSDSFNAASIAFGIRNVANHFQVLAELARVLRPGGRLAILEFAPETEPVLAGVYGFYLKHILPRLGGMISGNRRAYQYLHDSVVQFPATSDFLRLMEAAGFTDVRARKLTFGIVNLFSARRTAE